MGNGKLSAASDLISSVFSFWLALTPTNETLSPYCLCRSARGARACATYGQRAERNTTTAPLTPLLLVNDSSARVCPASTVLSAKPGAFAPARGPAAGGGSGAAAASSPRGGSARESVAVSTKTAE